MPLLSPFLKALVWFWIIDETYVLTFVMSVDLSKVGTYQVMEQWEVHGDEDGHEMKVIKLQLGKEEREKQKPSDDQGKSI